MKDTAAALALPIALIVAGLACIFLSAPEEPLHVDRVCEPLVRAAVTKTVHEERFRCDRLSSEAYDRGWANAVMDPCSR